MGEGSPTKTDYRKKGTLILTSLLEVLDQLSTNWWFGLVVGGIESLLLANGKCQHLSKTHRVLLSTPEPSKDLACVGGGGCFQFCIAKLDLLKLARGSKRHCVLLNSC